MVNRNPVVNAFDLGEDGLLIQPSGGISGEL
jgi:hypothetical protein